MASWNEVITTMNAELDARDKAAPPAPDILSTLTSAANDPAMSDEAFRALARRLLRARS